jgi:hypothetical protein
MLRFLRWLLSALILAVLLWFAVSVPIGKYTLWGHIVRIARTREARDLGDGAKSTAKDVAKAVQRELAEPPGKK